MIIERKIAVLPVVKAFLSSRYSVEPFTVFRNNQYGIFLFNALSMDLPEDVIPTDEKKQSEYLKKKEDYQNKYSETLVIQLTDRIWINQGLSISRQRQIDFNNLVLYNMDEDFCNWMTACSMFGGKKQGHMFRFREAYGLNENNFTLKCMEKKWERHRKAISA